ncbi:MAG: ComF family protein [Deltaproteobacteria bacterium]|nr:ComF family protein [Deltaproteobacteria bacterium]
MPEVLVKLGLALAERRCRLCLNPYPRPAAAETPEIRKAWNCGICPSCLSGLPRHSSGFCPRCGEIFASPFVEELCPACLRKELPWGRIYFHAAYSGLLRQLILRIKFQGNLILAEALGTLLAEHPDLLLRQKDYDCLVPISLHPERLAQRGFNQALEIARPVSAGLRLPLRPEMLRRVLRTRQQSGLTRKERAKNMRNAFAVPGMKARGLRILLLDDILTTGSTMYAAASSLFRAGAEAVDIVVLARTPGRNMCLEL